MKKLGQLQIIVVVDDNSRVRMRGGRSENEW